MVLDPNVRQVYLDALRPPEGYRLDRAIGTTYSLDLLALLVAPVSLALFDCDGWEEALPAPLVLLEALRRNAQRIALFCQVGRIQVPRFHHVLFSELEDMVIQTRRPGAAGVFHPKTWTLRYVSEAGDVWYRFLCLSRNLTFDRSWDLVFAAEGPSADTGAPRADAGPIADFLATLPGLAVSPVPDRVLAAIESFESEIRTVDLRLPSAGDFDAAATRFIPLGIDGHRRWPFPADAQRVLVVSPFLSDAALGRLTASGAGHVLVSRAESIDALHPATRERFEQLLVLDQVAGDDADMVSGGESQSDPEAGVPPVSPEHLPDARASEPTIASAAGAGPTEDPHEVEARGLHAKLFVAERDGRATLWVGSANATSAALFHDREGAEGRNVEFLVEISGPAGATGIDSILARTDGRAGFRDLLMTWRPPAMPADDDPTRRELERLLDAGVDATARAAPRLRAEQVDDDQFDLLLQWDGTAPSFDGIDARCWPVTVPEGRAQQLHAGSQTAGVRFTRLSTVGLSRFLAFDLSASLHGATRSRRFVLEVPLDGAPADRDARVLRHLISDTSSFLRYLLMLLTEGRGQGDAIDALLRSLARGPAERDSMALPGVPLLEELVRALTRSPERLDRVRRLVDDLCATPEGRALLPDGFEAVWRPIEASWQRRWRG